MDNSHCGLKSLTGEYLFQFSLSLSNIWLRYNKKPKGVFFYETQCTYIGSGTQFLGR